MRIELLKKKFWYFRLVTKQNGKILMVSESYRTKWNAKRIASKIAAINNIPFIERTK